MCAEKVNYMFDGIDLSPITDLIREEDISGWFKNNNGGSILRLFQECFAEYCNTKYAFATSSGSSAIYVALKACNVNRNDRVIVPAYTHIGSVAPIVLAGATPIFVDVDEFGNLNPKELENEYLDAKALIAVHQLAMPCNMDEIKAKFSGYIIEDASHALGSEYKGKRCGSLADIGCFSIGGGRTKTIACGEGGMITTSNEDLAEKCKNLRNHGDRVTDVDYPCFNFRMSELNAQVGLLQMPRLNMLNDWQLKRADYIRAHLPKNITVLPTPSYAHSVRYIVSGTFVKTRDDVPRDEFLKRMARNNWDGGVPRKNIGSGYSKLIYDIKYYHRFFRKHLAMSQLLRDNAVWIDWHRYPRTIDEIDELLRHINMALEA